MGLIHRWLGVEQMMEQNQGVLKEVLRTSQMQTEALIRMTSLMEKMSETWVPQGIPELRDDEQFRLDLEEKQDG